MYLWAWVLADLFPGTDSNKLSTFVCFSDISPLLWSGLFLGICSLRSLFQSGLLWCTNGCCDWLHRYITFLWFCLSVNVSIYGNGDHMICPADDLAFLQKEFKNECTQLGTPKHFGSHTLPLEIRSKFTLIDISTCPKMFWLSGGGQASTQHMALSHHLQQYPVPQASHHLLSQRSLSTSPHLMLWVLK